jgi:hypothetical protein
VHLHLLQHRGVGADAPVLTCIGHAPVASSGTLLDSNAKPRRTACCRHHVYAGCHTIPRICLGPTRPLLQKRYSFAKICV